MLISVFYDTGTFNADISGWQVSSTCDFTNMFENAEAFCPAAGFGCAGGWANTAITQADIPSCTVDFTCSDNKLRSLSIRDAISKLYSISTKVADVAARNAITSMYGMVANWDTSRVTNMENLFKSLPTSLFPTWNADLSNWDTSRVITMKNMFSPTVGSAASANALSAFNSVLTAWNVGNVLNMESSKLCFGNVPSFILLFFF